MLTPDEMRAKIMDRAAEDADFRARLLSDPKGAVEDELDLTIPSGFSVEVHEDAGDTAHLVLPPPSSLSEADLKELAGGPAKSRQWGGLEVSTWDDWNASRW